MIRMLVYLCKIGDIDVCMPRGLHGYSGPEYVVWFPRPFLYDLPHSYRKGLGTKLQSTRVTPMSHLLEKVFTDGQLQDASIDNIVLYVRSYGLAMMQVLG